MRLPRLRTPQSTLRRVLLFMAEEYEPEDVWVANCRRNVLAWEAVADRHRKAGNLVYLERAERVLAYARRLLAEAVENPSDPNDRRPIMGGQRIEPG